MSKNDMSLGAVIAWLVVIIAGIVGWVLNIVAIVGHDFVNEIGMGIVRVIGVFVPIIGAVLGYF
jgi:hypothetical protein